MAHFLKPPAPESMDTKDWEQFIGREDGHRRTSRRWSFDFVDSFIQFRLQGLADLRERIQKSYAISWPQPIRGPGRKDFWLWRSEFETSKQELAASQLDKALHSATQAVAHANNKNFQLPQAYLTRARVLMKMEKYSPAIIDLNRALAANVEVKMKTDAKNLKIGHGSKELTEGASSKFATEFTKKFVIESKQKKEETLEVSLRS